MRKSFYFIIAVLLFTACGKSSKTEEQERNMEMLENFINTQVENGTGKRYQNLDEAAAAFERQENMQRQQGQYRQVRCSSCNGEGNYYDYSDNKWYTCPTCNGNGYVLQYNQ